MKDKIRVAGYCRVSSDLAGQQTSLELQKKVYLEKIKSSPNWELVEIYSDDGVTGTSVRKRSGFQRMMEDARKGLLDIIITKSISRFARNTVECLESIRELQQCGVQLIFEKEGIQTGEAFSEMLLTVLAAFSQEESRSLSENLKWGIRKRFEQGIDRWVCVYGYTNNENGKYQVVPEEAEVIQNIYLWYSQGMTMDAIAARLTKQGVKSVAGMERWGGSTVHGILKNEKYVGDIRLQKKLTVDHLNHKEIKNRGELPSYYIYNHHTPIVDRKLYDRVQKIRQLHYGPKKKVGDSVHSNLYPYDKLVRCPYCWKPMNKHQLPVQDRQSYFICEEPGCEDFCMKAPILDKAVLRAYRELDVRMLEKMLKSTDPEQKINAEIAIQHKKEHPSFEKVDYYWLDDLVDRIEPGRHTMMPAVIKVLKTKGGEIKDDRTVNVFWKCGIKSTVFSGITLDKDMPQVSLAMYRAKRNQKNQEDENSIQGRET